MPFFKLHVQILLSIFRFNSFDLALDLQLHYLVKIRRQKVVVPFQNNDGSGDLLIFAQQFLHLLAKIILQDFKIIS